MRELTESVRIEFAARLLRDRARGAERPLADYQALYPGHEHAVAAEYDELRPAAPATPVHVGPYALEEELGRGGQGVVWRARDTRDGGVVALKLLPRSPYLDDVAPRLRREAAVLRRLDVDGVAPLLELGTDAGTAWLAMRYVVGETLAARIAAGRSPAGDVPAALRTVEALARILHAVHAAGVVHRDVKPANVLLRPDGRPVVLDFGAAHDGGEGPPLTLSGEAIGTPAYMAPEQLGARGPATAAVDVWALGVTLWELVAGERPFEGATHQALARAILEEEPPPLRRRVAGAPADLEVVLRTALAKERSARYGSAAALADDLARLRAGEPVQARAPSVTTRLARWSRRNPALSGSLAGLLLVLIGAVVVTSVLLRRTSDALAQVRRLSDLQRVAQLEADLALPRPANPRTAPALAAWLAAADRLRARADVHRERLGRARARLAELDARGAEDTDKAIEERWFAERLAELVAGLDRLGAARAHVERRLAFARSVRAATLEAHAEAWTRAAAEVRADPRFAGLELVPQLGLVPLGADPDSGLQEFAHLESGRPPRRDPGTGALERGDDVGVVLVLVPGGEAVVGAVPPEDGAPDGRDHVDAAAGRWERPVQRVRLDPFLIGKYELTQGQWLRHTGANPSGYQGDSDWIDQERPLSHPVELVSHRDCVRVLGQLDLTLPTEVQWEYATRAGTTTPWWTGSDVLSLQGAGNVADGYAATRTEGANWLFERRLDDGATGHVPVGRYAANPFGLHDVVGNCAEWCLDSWEDWERSAPRSGDGFVAPVEGDTFVMRGGGYSSGPRLARSSHRDGYLPDTRSYYIGVRPARRLEGR